MSTNAQKTTRPVFFSSLEFHKSSNVLFTKNCIKKKKKIFLIKTKSFMACRRTLLTKKGGVRRAAPCYLRLWWWWWRRRWQWRKPAKRQKNRSQMCGLVKSCFLLLMRNSSGVGWHWHWQKSWSEYSSPLRLGWRSCSGVRVNHSKVVALWIHAEILEA